MQKVKISKTRILTSAKILITLVLVTFFAGLIGVKPASAVPSFTGQPATTTGAITLKASSDWQPVLQFVAQASSTDDYLKQVGFTIWWLGGTSNGGEISSVAIYKSTTSVLSPSIDTQIATKSPSIGEATYFNWSSKGVNNDFDATGTIYWFYVAIKTAGSSIWSDNGAGTDDQISVSMAAGDIILRDGVMQQIRSLLTLLPPIRLLLTSLAQL